MAVPANGRKFKVRTGCITCKIRKVKCDENKPACTRCTKTGRKCDGYAKLSAENPEKPRSLVPSEVKRVSSNDITLYANITALPGIASADEHRWLEYFSKHAGPGLSDLTDKDFWTYTLPQLSVSEPAIRHALLAVGSSYARLEALSKPKNAMSVIEHDHSIKHYSLAIANLRRSLLQAPGDVTVPLICCLLFICLECLYENQTLMLDHLINGLKILSSIQSNGADKVPVLSVKQKLEQIFIRLDAQSTLYGRPVFLPSGDATLALNLEVPSTFDDIVAAKACLNTINSMSLNFIRLANDGTLTEKYQVSSAMLLRRRLQELFIAWKNALDNFDRVFPSKDYGYRDTIARLRIEYYASFIYLSNCLELEETMYDAYNDQFAALVSLAHTVLPSPEDSALPELELLSIAPSTNTSHSCSTRFSLEASLIPSLYLTAMKCRDPIIRRDAISLLRRHNGREGLWHAEMNWRLGRRIVEIEEGAMLIHQGAAKAYMEEEPSMRMRTSNGAVLSDLPSEKFRVVSADLNRPVGKELRSPAKATFYTRPNGVFEQEYSWQEDFRF